MNRRYRVLITDVDNTLFDWVDIWYNSFSAMFAEITRISEIDERILRDEIRSVHQQRGTTEYAFLIEEIPSIRTKFPDSDLLELFEPAIAAFRRSRKASLKLYPGVRETLSKLKNANVKVIAYTETMAFYTSYRFKKLELDGLVDVLYSPEDHDLPHGMTREQIRRYPAEQYGFAHTVHRHTPRGSLKPDATVLSAMLHEENVSPEECLYIGDSPMKDIPMAQAVGVFDVLAEYGAAQNRAEYQLLRDVTHWTNEDVARERSIREAFERGALKPSFIAHKGFAEILPFFCQN